MARHQEAQRAIHFAAAMGCMTIDEAQAMLRQAGYGPINPTSWQMVVGKYVPAFKKHPQIMGECILRPLSLTDLAKRVKELDEKA